MLLVLSACTAVTVSAQDAQYWTNQYGTRADLLGGVVVGSIADLSSTFYTPGMLALTTDNKHKFGSMEPNQAGGRCGKRHPVVFDPNWPRSQHRRDPSWLETAERTTGYFVSRKIQF